MTPPFVHGHSWSTIDCCRRRARQKRGVVCGGEVVPLEERWPSLFVPLDPFRFLLKSCDHCSCIHDDQLLFLLAILARAGVRFLRRRRSVTPFVEHWHTLFGRVVLSWSQGSVPPPMFFFQLLSCPPSVRWSLHLHRCDRVLGFSS